MCIVVKGIKDDVSIDEVVIIKDGVVGVVVVIVGVGKCVEAVVVEVVVVEVIVVEVVFLEVVVVEVEVIEVVVV